MDVQVEAIDKALCAIRHSKNPLDATIVAIDTAVAYSGPVIGGADLELLFVRLLDARGALDRACPERAPLFLYGAKALKALLALRGISGEGAEYMVYFNFHAGLIDNEPATEDLEKGAVIDTLRASMLDATLADLHFFKTGLVHELALQEAIRKGEAFDKARAGYVVARVRDEMSRRDHITMNARIDADEAKMRAYHNELGAMTAGEMLQ
ncbi:hypothetical protein [Methylocella silvestris]|uniref:Uncharacterized protein n=1 Tax=Methylocella silvestris TaxID=199596 RepID=A0A2J7THI5_METSI|nr:hypothetical protein [Methylocella silvestris]PNG26217.1 hypothetical protein CR492_08815 [Methylocella silvestris]